MRVIVFTENSRLGGMDTFIINLVRHWPTDDSLRIIVNSNHPGAIFLKNQLKGKAEIVMHQIPLNWSFLSLFINHLPTFIQKVFRKIFKIILLPYQYIAIKRLLAKLEADALVSVNGAYPGGETCRIANIAWRKLKKGCSIHSFHGEAEKEKNLFSFLGPFIDKKLIETTDYFVSVSEFCSKTILKRSKFKGVKDVETIPNGIILSPQKETQISLKEKLKLPKHSNLIVMVGNLSKGKGHSFMLKVMNNVINEKENTFLAIIGSGNKEERKEILRISKMYGIYNNIILTGEIEDIANNLYGADILVVPSQINESFGLSALEAMLNKIPVVATNVGGLPETIGKDGECGYLVKQDDHLAFSEKIIYLIDNVEISKQIGENGLFRANRLFAPKVMSQKYHDLITKFSQEK